MEGFVEADDERVAVGFGALDGLDNQALVVYGDKVVAGGKCGLGVFRGKACQKRVAEGMGFIHGFIAPVTGVREDGVGEVMEPLVGVGVGVDAGLEQGE